MPCARWSVKEGPGARQDGALLPPGREQQALHFVAAADGDLAARARRPRRRTAPRAGAVPNAARPARSGPSPRSGGRHPPPHGRATTTAAARPAAAAAARRRRRRPAVARRAGPAPGCRRRARCSSAGDSIASRSSSMPTREDTGSDSTRKAPSPTRLSVPRCADHQVRLRGRQQRQAERQGTEQAPGPQEPPPCAHDHGHLGARGFTVGPSRSVAGTDRCRSRSSGRCRPGTPASRRCGRCTRPDRPSRPRTRSPG